MKTTSRLLTVVLGTAVTLGTAFAAEPVPAAKKESGILSRSTVLTGYSVSNLKHDQKDYELVPLALRMPLWQSKDGNARGNWEVYVEPYVGLVTSPRSNMEAGVPFFLRYGMPIGSTGLKLFVEGGVGPMYMTQRTEEQDTKLNFIDQVGLGVRYALRESVDLELCWRFRHVSNAGISSPNDGINGQTILVGVTYRY